MRTRRADPADPGLNARERAWWNDNAPVIERVWEMDPEVSRVVRGRYLLAAREFFLSGRTSATVLEPGCGSGWVGQALAGPDLRIVGTDFSESQIDLARTRAGRFGLSEYCAYRVLAPDSWPVEADAVDGVLMHAFLHHLDDVEVDALLGQLRSRLRPGTRVWIYEPAFLSGEVPAPNGPAWWLGRSMHALCAVQRLASRLLGLRDEPTADSFDRLMRQAQENGWYLSPKEVPFDRDAFTARIRQHFTLHRTRWQTIYLVGWALETNLLRSAGFRRLSCSTLLRLAAACDHYIAARADQLGSALSPPAYGFAVWECEVPV